MHETQRDRAILRVLAERDVVSVHVLTEQLGISEATIRRDLKRLSDAGRLQRVRGGARTIERPTLIGQPLFGSDREQNTEAKRAIAQLAVSLCDPGDAVILDGGTTVFAMTEFLTGLGLQVLTPSLPVAQALSVSTNARILVPGGEFFREQQTIASPYTQPMVRSFSARRMFLSAQAVSRHGLLQTDSLLVRSQLEMIDRAEELVALVDSSKFERKGNLVASPLEELDVLISDPGLSLPDRRMLADAGVRVLIADPRKP